MMNDGWSPDSISYQIMGYSANGLFWILLLILIVWLISVMLNRKHHNSIHHSSYQYKTPVEILQKRYAEGNINEDEYNKRMAHLHKDTQ